MHRTKHLEEMSRWRFLIYPPAKNQNATLIEKFHFELEDIVSKWTISNFRTKHQEACVRWFCKMNNKFRFNGIPTVQDQPNNK